MNSPQIAPTPTAVREALDAKEAARRGIDPRPGKRVTLQIESRTSNMAICGRIVNYGVNVLPDVHHLDVVEYTKWVEDAPPEDLRAIEVEQRRRIAERDEAKREGHAVPRRSLEWNAIYRSIRRVDPKPFLSVLVLDDAPPDEPAAAPKARK